MAVVEAEEEEEAEVPPKKRKKKKRKKKKKWISAGVWICLVEKKVAAEITKLSARTTPTKTAALYISLSFSKLSLHVYSVSVAS